MEELLKKLAKLSEEVGYKEIITSKIEINPSGVRTCIEIDESMINYIKSISTLKKEDILMVVENLLNKLEEEQADEQK